MLRDTDLKTTEKTQKYLGDSLLKCCWGFTILGKGRGEAQFTFYTPKTPEEHLELGNPK